MKLFIAFFFLTQLQFLFSQETNDLDYLLNEISKVENSKEILNNESSQKVIEKGVGILMMLSDKFEDNTITNVKSECQEKILTKGEISIILADHILAMPYAHVTGIQNCTITFCENNPNFIEYYLNAINRKGAGRFKEDYQKWLKETKVLKDYKNKKK